MSQCQTSPVINNNSLQKTDYEIGETGKMCGMSNLITPGNDGNVYGTFGQQNWCNQNAGGIHPAHQDLCNVDNVNNSQYSYIIYNTADPELWQTTLKNKYSGLVGLVGNTTSQNYLSCPPNDEWELLVNNNNGNLYDTTGLNMIHDGISLGCIGGAACSASSPNPYDTEVCAKDPTCTSINAYFSASCQRTAYNGDPGACCVINSKSNIGMVNVKLSSMSNTPSIPPPIKKTTFVTNPFYNPNISTYLTNATTVATSSFRTPCSNSSCTVPQGISDVVGFKYTCDPVTQGSVNAASTGCQTAAANFCSNYAMMTDLWLKVNSSPSIENGLCYNYILDNNAPGVVGASLESFLSNVSIDDPDPNNALTINTLLEKCQDGYCYNALQTACKGITRDQIQSAYSDSDNLSNKNLIMGCSCNMPPAQYFSLGQEGVDEQNAICDPLCVMGNTVSGCSSIAGCPSCSETVCVIDNVTVSSQTSIGGPVNFDQYCGGKGSGGMTVCYIGDITIDGAPTSAEISQNCNKCISITDDPSAPGKLIDCQTGLPITSDSIEDKITTFYDTHKTETWLGIGGLIAVIVAIVVIYLIYRHHRKV